MNIFVDSQRKGLEKRFQIQKYISKPDRKKLAERLGLKDSQASFYISMNTFLNFLTNYLSSTLIEKLSDFQLHNFTREIH